MRHIALEGRCFVLGCNQFNRKSDYPPGFIDDEYDNVLDNEKGSDYIMSRGGSVIISPLGKFLAGKFDFILNVRVEFYFYTKIDLKFRSNI